MQVKIEKNELVIRLPINKPLKPSKSGKSLIVASSHGNQNTEVVVDKKVLVVGVNAFVYKNA